MTTKTGPGRRHCARIDEMPVELDSCHRRHMDVSDQAGGFDEMGGCEEIGCRREGEGVPDPAAASSLKGGAPPLPFGQVSQPGSILGGIFKLVPPPFSDCFQACSALAICPGSSSSARKAFS